GADAHGPRRRPRPRDRARLGGRRLPDEALLVRGAPGARPRGRTPRGRRALDPRVRAARAPDAACRPDAVAPAADRGGVGHRLRGPLERRRRLHPLPAREDRPAVRTLLDRDGARRRVPAAQGRVVSSLPIRVRLTLPFALLMAIVFATMGTVIYVRVGGALLQSVDQNLQAQAAEARSHANEGRQLLDRDVSDGPAIAQALLPDGTTEDASPATLPPLLRGGELRRVVAGERRWEIRDIPGLRGDWRLLAVPVRVDGRRAALVVGRSIAPRTETLHRLAREFLFAAPAALLVAILFGYALAAAALRPVEA